MTIKEVANMFEVNELLTGDCYMVYEVRTTQINNITLFLFYRKGKWVWDFADDYEPKL
jgi:hypothetical protein